MITRLSKWFIAMVCLTPLLHAQEKFFDFEVLRYRAKMLAAAPYESPKSLVPEALMRLTYDQHRDIRFNPTRNWWREARLPFELQFFHPGFIFDKTVQISELSDRASKPIPFSTRLFDYGKNNLSGVKIPETMGFAGFRLLYPLNKSGDELGAFLGASYFRFLCQKAVYGLSARGLAVNTAEPTGEEFPSFREFWVEKPLPGSTDLVVYALLDGPSVSGAYRLVIHPGADTVVQVHAVVYFRQVPKTVGLAPLTSMFWHGENSSFATDDFRPEVHDSDGLLMNTGSGEWLWRPLTNPSAVRVAAFSDQNPRGFGLLQRDRHFESYEDLEASYHQRPSAWVEPIGSWGAGTVRLVELPSPDETHDNIVAFWSPRDLPAPGEPLEFAYKLHWFLDQIHPPAGYAVATRIGHSITHEPELRRFVVDFDGPYLNKQGPDPAIEPVVSVGEGASLANVILQKNPFNGTWKVSFAIRPDGSGRPVELRCFIRKPPHVLTETWSYLWQP